MPEIIPANGKVELATDASKKFLDSLLGSGWDTWGLGGLGGNQGSELMLEVFAAFNSVALAAVSVLFLWVSAIATAGTAHEGVAFGKKYSSLWMPLRFVGSMGALAPIFKGLSLFQLILLACIGWSINFANGIWKIGTNYFVEHGGRMTLQKQDDEFYKAEYEAFVNGILKYLTIQHYLKDQLNKDVKPADESPQSWRFEPDTFDSKTGKYVYDFPAEKRFVGEANIGQIEIPANLHPGKSMIAEHKKTAVNKIIKLLGPLAKQLADPRTLKKELEISALKISEAVNIIKQEMRTATHEYVNNKNNILNASLTVFKSDADKQGWLLAGSSYWIVSMINDEIRRVSKPDFKFEEGYWKGFTFGLGDYEAVIKRYENCVGIKNKDTKTKKEIDDEEAAAKIEKVINSWNPFKGLFNYFTTDLIEKDPIQVLAGYGHTMIISAWGMLGAGIVAGFAPLGGVGFFMSVLFLGVIPLMGWGIMLAYYLPAIPFIRWISAIGGWIILVVETLIAAPLWIAAHALPEGDGLAGQSGRRGYMLFLGVMLRPPLMVAGFYCAMLLVNTIGKIIGLCFQVFIKNLGISTPLGIVGGLAIIVLLGVLVMMLANKFFGLINYLPENITNWIGQQLHNLGEKEDVNAAKGIMVGVGANIGGKGNEAVGGIKSALVSRRNNASNGQGKEEVSGGDSMSAPQPPLAIPAASEKGLSSR